MRRDSLALVLEAECKGKDQQARKYGDASVVNGLRGASWGNSALAESLQAQFGDIAGLAGIGSRGLSGANHSAVSDLHSFYLGGVDASRVISTGSWSGPSADNAATNLDTHGVFHFDALNEIPTDGVTSQRVDDRDSFIKIEDARMDKEQVGAPENESAPQNCIDISPEFSAFNRGANKACNDERSYRNRCIDGSWAVKHRVATGDHVHIFSRHEELEGLSA